MVSISEKFVSQVGDQIKYTMTIRGEPNTAYGVYGTGAKGHWGFSYSVFYTDDNGIYSFPVVFLTAHVGQTITWTVYWGLNQSLKYSFVVCASAPDANTQKFEGWIILGLVAAIVVVLFIAFKR